MRIRPLAGLGERGFSFDLVSRRKAVRVEEPTEVAETAVPEPEALAAPVAAPVVEEDHAPLSGADLTVEPFESVLQQLRGALAADTPTDAEDEIIDEPEDEAPLALTPQMAVEAEPQPVRDITASILRLMPENVVRPEPRPEPRSEPRPEAAPVVPVAAVPAPAAPSDEAPVSAPRRGNRVKTTFLGFERSDGRIEDVFARDSASPKANANRSEYPFGWVVIIKGPGRGTSVAIGAGVSQIGRGDDQAIQLDFGDTSISRQNHAAIAFDDEERKFYLGHGGKANIVRLNGKPVLSTEVLSDGDLIRIGETTMTFVAFCGEDFVWEDA